MAFDPLNNRAEYRKKKRENNKVREVLAFNGREKQEQ